MKWKVTPYPKEGDVVVCRRFAFLPTEVRKGTGTDSDRYYLWLSSYWTVYQFVWLYTWKGFYWVEKIVPRLDKQDAETLARIIKTGK